MLISLGDWLCDGGDPADCGLRDPAVRPSRCTELLCGALGVGAQLRSWSRPRWRGALVSRTSDVASCALAGPSALVPDCAVLRSRRGDADLARDLRPASANSSRPVGGRERLPRSQLYFLLQLVLFQLAEEIGFTGFLQHHWQDRYSPMKLTLYVALLWALWHLTDHFAEEGWGLESVHIGTSRFRYRVRRAVLRPRLVRVVLQPHRFQRAAGGDLPRELRCLNQPALPRRGAGVEHRQDS